MEKTHPGLFPALAEGQAPQILWIGCSDSRVPETTLLDLLPGEVFTHRNIANMLPPDDLSSRSVLKYAIEFLGVAHVVVCGHTRCGGVDAVVRGRKIEVISSWLQGLVDVFAANRSELEAITDHGKRVDRLVELNVIAQVQSALRNPDVQAAMNSSTREVKLQVHGVVHDVTTGRCRIVDVPKDE